MCGVRLYCLIQCVYECLLGCVLCSVHVPQMW